MLIKNLVIIKITPLYMLEFVYDYFTRKDSVNNSENICNFCEEKIEINDTNYFFKIIGSGAHDNKVICYHCMKQKINNKNRKKIISVK